MTNLHDWRFFVGAALPPYASSLVTDVRGFRSTEQYVTQHGPESLAGDTVEKKIDTVVEHVEDSNDGEYTLSCEERFHGITGYRSHHHPTHLVRNETKCVDILYVKLYSIVPNAKSLLYLWG